MARFPDPLVHLVQRQRGVVTLRQLRRFGIDLEHVERLRGRGLLVRHHPDVLRVAGTPLDLETSSVIVCLAHPHGVIGGAAAATLWGFAGVFHPMHPELIHGDGCAIGARVRGVSYRSCEHAADLVTARRSSGIRLLDRAETWLDCVADLNAEHATAFTRGVLDRHCSAEELLGAVERWESRRRARPPGRSRRLVMELAA